MAVPKVLILTGYGINCEEETGFAFQHAGAKSDIIHINDLIENPGIFTDYQMVMFPGGFSYGDDTGSGKALAARIKNNLIDELMDFTQRDTLTLGICNGFQVMVNIGILPYPQEKPWRVRAALEHNKSYIYQCRWVDLAVEESSPSVFTRGISRLHIPVAHGEGNFFAPDDVIENLEGDNLVTMRYALKDGSRARGHFPENPNGSINDIASICDTTGRIMGMMPHPERGMFFSQRDDWTLRRELLIQKNEELPEAADGMKIFENAVTYFN